MHWDYYFNRNPKFDKFVEGLRHFYSHYKRDYDSDTLVLLEAPPHITLSIKPKALPPIYNIDDLNTLLIMIDEPIADTNHLKKIQSSSERDPWHALKEYFCHLYTSINDCNRLIEKVSKYTFSYFHDLLSYYISVHNQSIEILKWSLMQCDPDIASIRIFNESSFYIKDTYHNVTITHNIKGPDNDFVCFELSNHNTKEQIAEAYSFLEKLVKEALDFYQTDLSAANKLIRSNVAFSVVEGVSNDIFNVIEVTEVGIPGDCIYEVSYKDESTHLYYNRSNRKSIDISPYRRTNLRYVNFHDINVCQMIEEIKPNIFSIGNVFCDYYEWFVNGSNTHNNLRLIESIPYIVGSADEDLKEEDDDNKDIELYDELSNGIFANSNSNLDPLIMPCTILSLDEINGINLDKKILVRMKQMIYITSLIRNLRRSHMDSIDTLIKLNNHLTLIYDRFIRDIDSINSIIKRIEDFCGGRVVFHTAALFNNHWLSLHTTNHLIKEESFQETPYSTNHCFYKDIPKIIEEIDQKLKTLSYENRNTDSFSTIIDYLTLKYIYKEFEPLYNTSKRYQETIINPFIEDSIWNSAHVYFYTDLDNSYSSSSSNALAINIICKVDIDRSHLENKEFVACIRSSLVNQMKNIIRLFRNNYNCLFIKHPDYQRYYEEIRAIFTNHSPEIFNFNLMKGTLMGIDRLLHTIDQLYQDQYGNNMQYRYGDMKIEKMLTELSYYMDLPKPKIQEVTSW